MTSPSTGIQQLLAAEKKAADKVGEARKRKARRLKQAKDEATEEIEKYRGEREKQFKDFETKHVGSREGVAQKIDADTRLKIEEMNRALGSNKEPCVCAWAFVFALGCRYKAGILQSFEINRNMALNPKQSGEFIVKNAKYVKVQDVGVRNLAHQVIEGILTGSLDIKNFTQHEFHPKPTEKHAMNWIFLIDTLNFCFWTKGDQPNKWKVDGQTGYFALCAAINRAMRNSIDITNPQFYATIKKEQLEEILKSDDGETKVPLLDARIECLHQVGKKLLEKYDGNFENVVKAAEGSAEKLLQLIVDEFPCFRDEAEFKGQHVTIYKRAQILIGDVYACYQAEGLGSFHDLNNTITMFADYRVPQVLVHFGALIYSDELMSELKNDKILKNGEEKEVEIRGASIYIVEVAKEIILRELTANHPEVSLKHVNSILIDHFLWDYRRANAELLAYIPFHKTFSVYY
ncbi:CLUMA_CG018944, isoform A [Clunio marinus]|uniref:Queuosine 5'-phosphate N-glycosylase/hydrolase n=1 Tax=Clunio marinus TaxID=568069 RepID=A0A1J1J187_9DIPT|nr:CLUMA_CG018944, isoform A [Clunio marinus]